jgi:hypothetical protein
VTQDYDNLEILVSDNASEDATREVVESYHDPRIRYINPMRRLEMSEHWEFALGHVSDGYVGIIGDDDAMLPRSVEAIAELVSASNLPLVWPIQQYFWPSYPDPALANSLILPLRQAQRVEEIRSSDIVRRVLERPENYPALPSPYFGVVPVDAFARVRASSGTVFHSITPDIYSGFAVAAVCDRVIRSDLAYSLAGQSSHSNGASQLSGRDKDDANSPVAKFNRENTRRFHDALVFAPTIPVLVAEAALQARDHAGLQVQVDLKHVIRSAVRGSQYVLNPGIREPTESALLEIAEMNGLVPEFKKELRAAHRWALLRLAKEAFVGLALRQPLIVCDPATVRNAYDAAVFVDLERPRYARGFSGLARRFQARMDKVRRASRTLSGRFNTRPSRKQ